LTPRLARAVLRGAKEAVAISRKTIPSLAATVGSTAIDEAVAPGPQIEKAINVEPTLADFAD
jgi:hypothetical protein